MAAIRALSADSNISPEIAELTRTQPMSVAVLTRPGHFQLQNLAKPSPGPREVLIRMQGCGLCASNIPPYQGRAWFEYPFEPGAPGHEGWGVVEELGSGVDHLKRGDRVAALSYHAFATHDLAHADHCVRLPQTLDHVPFPGEPLGCAMNIFGRADIQPGQTVAVVGAGFLGTILCDLASRAGARVIAISRRQASLDFAAQFGARHTILMKDHASITAQVEKLTGGELCDRVIECVGLQGPLDLAARITRIRGKLIIAGYHQDGARQVDMQMWNWRGLDVINAHERDPMVYITGMRKAARAIAEGHLDPTPLYTHRFKLAEINEAFKTAIERPDQFLKALILFPESPSAI